MPFLNEAPRTHKVKADDSKHITQEEEEPIQGRDCEAADQKKPWQL